MDIACIGEMLIDFLPGEEPGVYIRKAGGAPANAAVAMARNGLDVGFCGTMGNDDFGRFLVETLKNNHVRVLCPELLDEAVTTMAFVTLDASGDRSFTFARKPGADMLLTRRHIDEAHLETAAVVHAGSLSLSRDPAADATVYALEQAKRRGKLISFDLNYRNVIWNDDKAAAAKAVQQVLPLVDLLKISDEEEEFLGMPVEQAAEHYGIAAVVETLGGDGAKCFWNGKTLRVPGRKAKCVDTTGAGDAFWGGFLACLLRGGVRRTDDLNEALLDRALRYGNVAGWLCVQKKGAMESLPTTAEIEAISGRDEIG